VQDVDEGVDVDRPAAGAARVGRELDGEVGHCARLSNMLSIGRKMSLYQVQKFLFQLNRSPELQERYLADRRAVLTPYELTDEEIEALVEPDIGLLFHFGVNGQILMHYAAFLGIEWFDYLERMRQGVARHGPVRAGVYAMTGGGHSFAPEGRR